MAIQYEINLDHFNLEAELNDMWSRFLYIAFCLPLFFAVEPVKAQQVEGEEISEFIENYQILLKQNNLEGASYQAIQIVEMYEAVGKLKDALFYAKKALENAQSSRDDRAEAKSLYSLGRIQMRLGKKGNTYAKENKEYLQEAVQNLKHSVNIYSRTKERQKEDHIWAFIYGGESQLALGDYKGAAEPLELGIKFAQTNRFDRAAKYAAELLISIYAYMDNDQRENYYKSIYQAYLDSEMAQDSIQKQSKAIEDLEFIKKLRESEIEKKNLRLENARLKQLEAETLLEQRDQINLLLTAISVIIFIFLVISFFMLKSTKKKNKELANQKKKIEEYSKKLGNVIKSLKIEQNKSWELLLNILPEKIARQLHDRKKPQPLYYGKVSILFCDFKGFTRIASDMRPTEIVKDLEECFEKFDEIVEAHNLEKIKTLGDGYMAAGGIPTPNNSNPLDAIKAGIQMINFINARNKVKRKMGLPVMELRVGVHTGPAVAGIIGKKKFAYDLWGDSVNVASRVESAGEAGRVNISADTYQYVKDEYFFTYRGRIPVKNKGEIEMYFVEGKVKYAAP